MTSNPRLYRPGLRKLLGALIATTAVLFAAAAAAEPQPYAPEGAVRDVTADESGYGGLLALPIGGSRILRFAQPIGRVMIGNPKIGDVIPLSDRTLYVLAKAAGATSLTAMPRGGVDQPLATLDLRVGYDVDGVKRALADVLPGEAVQVVARGDGLMLTGKLSSSVSAARAAAVAEQYAAGHVVNLTSVRAAEQVMISVRVAEVQRTALQQLGLSTAALFGKNGDLLASGLATGDSSFPPVIPGVPPSPGRLASILQGAVDPNAFANLGGIITGGDLSAAVVLNALERRGLATTLAEPNLVALSGETAVFFAGGEFPIPVPQQGALGGLSTITIEYKQYGVSIGFTPTVYGDTINLLVAPEVSALDQQNSIVLQGFRIPGLTTRRAKTTIELRNGQSFAIAGLIRREFTDNMRGVPGAASIPVIGALFRSKGYQNNETEVVIIVTAHLAAPTDRSRFLLPTDLQQAPSAAELYLGDAIDKPRLAPAGPLASLAPASDPRLANAPAGSSATAPVIPPAAAAAPAAPVAPADVAGGATNAVENTSPVTQPAAPAADRSQAPIADGVAPAIKPEPAKANPHPASALRAGPAVTAR